MAQQNHPPTLRQSLNTQKSFNLPCFFHWTLALRFVDYQALNPTFLCWYLFGSSFCLVWQFWKKQQFQVVAFCRIWPTFALNKLAREGDKRVNIKSDISSPQSETYCWWKKSCTTWDLQNPVNKGINYLSTGAGFQSSTVWCLNVFRNDLGMFLDKWQLLAHSDWPSQIMFLKCK